ncbi:MAG: FtsX-like permease family protein, partial [Coriobacteriales bacterium]|nr:FtsX-like permease family protein [Coriobacteriales bacterium]
VGLIADDALAGPDSLLAVRGLTPEEILRNPEVTLASGFAGQAFPTGVYYIVAVIGGLAVLIPVLLLISIITRLGAAQRSESLAILRLIGAPPALVVRLAVLETGLTTLLGALVGVGLAWLLSPLFAQIKLSGESFFPADIQTSLPLALASVVALTVATILIAWLRARRSRVLGLGGSRQISEPRPSPWWLLMLPLGLVLMMAPSLPGVGRALADNANALAASANVLVVAGFVAVLAGLVLAGPPLTYWASRFAGRYSRRAAGVIAAARIRLHPRASFRAVGGVVVAVFVVSFFSAAITTAAADARDNAVASAEDAAAASAAPAPDAAAPASNAASAASAAPSATPATASEAPALLQTSAFARNALQGFVANLPEDTNIDELIAGFERLDGVTGAALGWYRASEEARMDGAEDEYGWTVFRTQDLPLFGIAPAALPELAGAAYTELSSRWLHGFAYTASGTTEMPRLRPASDISGQDLLPNSFFIATDGSPEALERARTAVLKSPLHFAMPPRTWAENQAAGSDNLLQEFAFLAYIGILIATAVSGVAMAVSTIVGILDRRRTLALMRLAGMPARTLRQMITAETILPLCTVFLLSVALGFAVAQILLAGLTNGRRYVDLSLIDPVYFLALGASLLLALLALLATFPTARRTTALSATRFE